MHDGDHDRRPTTRRRAASPSDSPAHPHGSSHGHGHGHGHGPAAPASKRVRTLLLVLLLPCVLATAVGALLLYPFGHDQPTGPELGLHQVPVRGEVTAVARASCSGEPQLVQPSPGVGGDQADPTGQSGQTGQADQAGGPDQSGSDGSCVLVSVLMSDGDAAGRTVGLTVPVEPSTPRFSAGDQVVLAYSGSDPTEPGSYQLVDFQRDTPMLLLAVLFAVAVLILGRWQGLAALGALVLSFVVLLLFVLPAILAGANPLTVAVVGAGLIMFLVLYLTHGVSARTSTAVLGTLVSLALIGALGALFAALSQLTGLDEDTANLVGLLGHGIDSRGLLLAGVVIGALGVLDDVTVTQTSAVWELRRANPGLGWRQLYAAGLRIGRDHISSAVNTLVMAYAGAALPVLLSFAVAGRGFGEILTAQAVAQEIVRTLVGSIGLIAAVPLTTALAAVVASQEPAPLLPGQPEATPLGTPRSGRRPATRENDERDTDERGVNERGANERGADERGADEAGPARREPVPSRPRQQVPDPPARTDQPRRPPQDPARQHHPDQPRPRLRQEPGTPPGRAPAAGHRAAEGTGQHRPPHRDRPARFPDQDSGQQLRPGPAGGPTAPGWPGPTDPANRPPRRPQPPRPATGWFADDPPADRDDRR
ncbi:YibE/F family protein [Goodfellowiella coeruleoviolacea]|uniref:Membrane protein n=1 Tax=Goodfellowiella coeruleoviolacea TaxID=334858 RepID=A0AAE3GF95_9PSEU|nr:YibE/F family protein [Goodfellowiella coeruleoviolacea]MCP2166638.1 putative membrane protein [Goodfellowiella coeruleoviolacea]